VINKGYPEAQALIVKKCKNEIELNRYTASTYKDCERGL